MSVLPWLIPSDYDDNFESLHSAASHSALALMYNNTPRLLFFCFFQDSNLLKQNNLLQLPLVNVITALSH